ncbi:MAG: hypothetical protein U5K76_14550 [Woeseiaceae bacterium]|nr:hypothetical protein [Woeseiaceae bacterium]
MNPFALLPGAVCALMLGLSPMAAADELDVTMRVLDDLADVDADLRRIRAAVEAPELSLDEAIAAAEAARQAELEATFAEIPDDFEHDDVNSNFRTDLLEEGDFEEHETVDDLLEEGPDDGQP